MKLLVLPRRRDAPKRASAQPLFNVARRGRLFSLLPQTVHVLPKRVNEPPSFYSQRFEIKPVDTSLENLNSKNATMATNIGKAQICTGLNEIRGNNGTWSNSCFGALVLETSTYKAALLLGALLCSPLSHGGSAWGLWGSRGKGTATPARLT